MYIRQILYKAITTHTLWTQYQQAYTDAAITVSVTDGIYTADSDHNKGIRYSEKPTMPSQIETR